LPLVKLIYPKLDRTIFVYNKLADQLPSFTSSRDLNRFLNNVSSTDAASFFVTLPNAQRRAKIGNSKTAYKTFVDEQLAIDLKLLEQLQFDRKYSNSIGIAKVRTYILDYTWRKLQDNIPELLKRLRSFKKTSEHNLETIKEKISALELQKLRGTSSRYATQFLQSIEKLLNGTLDGNPTINGQTLKEEKMNDQIEEWRTQNWTAINVDPNWPIPHQNSKLYGGQQFERLLAEFKEVMEHQTIGPLNEHDIATASGPMKLNSASNCTWAASDIAQRHIQKNLHPLLDQLIRRAVYIFKRLVDIAEEMVLNSQKRSAHKDLGDINQFPFFIHNVKQLYTRFVDVTAEQCKQKCVDEFTNTRLIFWEITNVEQSKKINQLSEKQDVTNLATEIFTITRDRISKNVSLKIYNYLYVTLQTKLFAELQGSITTMSDKELSDMFEIATTTEKLKQQLSNLELIRNRYTEQENTFKSVTSTFSKTNPKTIEF